MERLTFGPNLAEEHPLFRTFAFAASVIVAGLGFASQPASAASLGQLPAAALADFDTLTKAQYYWEEPRYRYRRQYRDRDFYEYERPSYGPRRYSARRYYEPPRKRGQYGRAYGAPRRQAAPPVRGCYPPPPMPYRTPRVVCSY